MLDNIALQLQDPPKNIKRKKKRTLKTTKLTKLLKKNQYDAILLKVTTVNPQ